MPSVVRIIISSSASAAMAGFAAIRSGLSRLAANTRVAWGRMTSYVIAHGGVFRVLGTAISRIPAALGRMAAAARAAFSSMATHAASAARAVGRTALAIGRTALRVGTALSPFALWTGGILAVIGAVSALGGALANALGIIQLVAPAAIAAGAAFVVFKMGMNGIVDALKAGASGDMEKFNKELAKLPWSARQAVLTLLDLQREWKSTQRSVQENFWKGAREDFIAVSRAIQPIADKWLPKLATAFANVRQWISMVLLQSADTGQLDKIMAGVHQFFSGLMTTVPYLLQAFLDIAQVAAPSLGSAGDGIADAARRFAGWIRKLRDDGSLAEWLEKAKGVWRQLIDVAKAAWDVIKGFFKPDDEGNTKFLDGIKNSLEQLSDWVNSGKAQGFLDRLREVAAALANIIVWINNVVMWFQRGWDGLQRDAQRVRDFLTGSFAAVSVVVMGVVSVFSYLGSVIANLGNAFGWIGNAIGNLGALAGAASRAASAIAGIGSGKSQGYAKPIIKGGGGGTVPKFYASGGHPRGLSWVGEHGRELVDFGTGGRVYNNGQSEQMVADSGGSYGHTSIEVKATPGASNWMGQMVTEAVRRGYVQLKVSRGGKVVTA